MKRIATSLAAIAVSVSALAGAWGDGSFENDDALDWVSQCTQSACVDTISATLNNAINAKFIEASDGAAVVAASEVIAAASGKPSPSLPSELNKWLKKQPSAKLLELAPKARQALARVKDPKASELKQLWSEGKKNEWAKRIQELEARLAK